MNRIAAALALLLAGLPALAWEPTPLARDPLVFMPGSQRGSVTLQPPTWCDNCHGRYDAAIEPAHNWRGSMMAQASRDPLWLAAMAAAEQDSIWLLGTPNAGDLCIRCHVPAAWLGGRGEPVNGTSFTAADQNGVSCDVCHRMVDPMPGRRLRDVAPDEGAAVAAASQTREADLALLAGLKLFDGTFFFDPAAGMPRLYGAGFPSGYAEATGGQYVVDPTDRKRGPRSDALPMHPLYYSRFHRSSAFCGTCHDVSNAVAANRASAGASSQLAAGTYFHLERTFSEFTASAYGRGGAETKTAYGRRRVSRCQDCHMPPVRGKAANMPAIPLRADLALHDLSGGNAWILGILASVDRTGSGYDAANDAILSGSKYPGAKIDVAGLQGFGQALLDGRSRALAQLEAAATLELVSWDRTALRLRVRNNTGHKLISGFPEGRRMWLNVKFHDSGGSLVGEVNPYEPLVTARDGQGNEQYASGATLRATRDDLVWEAKMSSSLTGEASTFHFVLVTGRTKDNRIPPQGFDTAEAAHRLSLPARSGADAPDLFTAAEYAGGYDEVEIAAPSGAATWRATLYYQTTSREYVEFLRDEVNGTASTLALPAPSGEAKAYAVQTDPFFAPLRDWGRAIWDLWLHNGGAAPVEMTSLAPRRRVVAR
ncbi:MAG TPA: multiheme c-type cytochrome [Thermoanaerobaculia bacterium]